jgi:hypothetical protein
MPKVHSDYKPEQSEGVSIGGVDYDAVPVVFDQPGDCIAGYYRDILRYKKEGEDHETQVSILQDCRDPSKYYRVKWTSAIRTKMTDSNIQPEGQILFFVLVSINKNDKGFTFKKFNIFQLASPSEIPYD